MSPATRNVSKRSEKSPTGGWCSRSRRGSSPDVVRRDYDGTGLGLPIVHHLVDASGGTIALHPAPAAVSTPSSGCAPSLPAQAKCRRAERTSARGVPAAVEARQSAAGEDHAARDKGRNSVARHMSDGCIPSHPFRQQASTRGPAEETAVVAVTGAAPGDFTRRGGHALTGGRVAPGLTVAPAEKAIPRSSPRRGRSGGRIGMARRLDTR